MGWRGWILAMAVGLFLPGGAAAQSGETVRVTAEARPLEVGTAGRITFTVRVEGASRSMIQTPEPPSTANLVLRERTPTTQRHLSFDEGAMQRSVTFEWRYEPIQPGTARIHGVAVTVRGETYTTDEIRIRVVPQAERSASAPRGQGEGSSSGSAADESESEPLRPRALFIEASVTNDRVYQNEQVGVGYRLFFRPGVRLRRSRLADAWDAPGFWREELDVATRPTPRSRQKYGRTYETVALKRVALFPTRPGTLQVDPLRIETEVQGMRSAHGSEGPVRSSFQPVTLSSRTLDIAVRALPPGAPPAFDGAVGQFSVRGRADADSAAVGEGVRLTAEIEGAGNLTTIGPPEAPALSEFEVYDPTVEMELDRQGTALTGRKTFVYTLVPRSGGTHTIPPFTFAFFDPEAERYVTRRSEPLTLHVAGATAARGEGRTGGGFPVDEVAGPLEESGSWHRTDRAPLHRRLWTYLALLLPLGAAGGGWLYRRWKTTHAPKPSSDTTSTSTFDDVQRPLDAAERHLRLGEVRPFYRAVEQALTAAPSAVEEEAVQDLLETCRTAPFAPDPPTQDEMRAVLKETRSHLRPHDSSTTA